MKNRFLLFAVATFALFAFVGCSEDDDFSFQFDQTGNKIVETSRTITNKEFQEKIVGKALVYVEGYEILNDGTLSSQEYYESREDMMGFAGEPYYYFENNATWTKYFTSDAIPGKVFDKDGYTYDEKSGCIMNSDGKKVFQILEVGGFIKAVTYIGYYSSDNKDHYGYFTYRFMTDEELKKVQETYTMDFNDPNPWQ